MLLRTPQDHAVASIRLVVTELLQTNRVLMAHELIGLLHHQVYDTGITAAGATVATTATTTTTTTTSDEEDGPRRAVTSLYPSWYRRGTPSPDHRRHGPLDGRRRGDQTCRCDLCEPGPDGRRCPPVQLAQQQQEDEILSCRLWAAFHALAGAGLAQASHDCVSFGLRHGLRQAMLRTLTDLEEWSAGFRVDGGVVVD